MILGVALYPKRGTGRQLLARANDEPGIYLSFSFRRQTSRLISERAIPFEPEERGQDLFPKLTYTWFPGDIGADIYTTRDYYFFFSQMIRENFFPFHVRENDPSSGGNDARPNGETLSLLSVARANIPRGSISKGAK